MPHGCGRVRTGATFIPGAESLYNIRVRIRSQTTADDLYRPVRDALNAWHKSGRQGALDFLEIVRDRVQRLPEKDRPGALRLKTNEVLLEAIEQLEGEDPDGAAILRRRFLDRQTVLAVAHRHSLDKRSLMRRQEAAIRALASDILARERGLRLEQRRRFEAGLPSAQYSRLFGVRGAAEKLRARLLSPDPPWLAALTGMGGIGKTALAHFVVRDLFDELGPDGVFWLTAAPAGGQSQEAHFERRYLSRLGELARRLDVQAVRPEDRQERVRRALKASSSLVVIDNLESEAEVAWLCERLPELAGPARFLLTSRSLPPVSAEVHTLPLEELPYDDAAALIRFHSSSVGKESLAIRTEKDIRAVYAATGGNPLAIKLVVGLATRLPLPQALQGLERGQDGSVEEMYRRIYARAWQALPPDARRLLLSMPLAADQGGEPAQLIAASGLEEAGFWQAVSELVSRSLLHTQGDAASRRYSIHPLTRTFLHSLILQQDERDGSGSLH